MKGESRQGCARETGKGFMHGGSARKDLSPLVDQVQLFATALARDTRKT